MSSGRGGLDTGSRQDLHDGSSRPDQQDGSRGSVSSRDELYYSSIGCFKNDGRDTDIGSKCPNGAAGVPLSAEQSEAVRLRDEPSENGITDTDLRVAATVSTSSPPPPTVEHKDSGVSAVLVLNLKDAHLATLLLTTLRACGGMDIFRDFFVVVPGRELSQIEAVLLQTNVDSSNGKFFKGTKV